MKILCYVLHIIATEYSQALQKVLTYPSHAFLSVLMIVNIVF